MIGPFNNDWAISYLKFEYENSVIEILLGEWDCYFISPQLSLEQRSKLTYNFKNGKGKYFLLFTKESANCRIENSAIESKWIIDLGSAEVESVKVKNENGNQIHVIIENEDKSTSVITFVKPYPQLLVKTISLTQELDFFSGQLITKRVDEASLVKDKSAPALLQTNLSKGYIEIDNHKVSSGIFKKIWYDTEKKRYFHLIRDEDNWNADDVHLLGVIGELAYYFLPDKQVVFYQKNFDSEGKLFIVWEDDQKKYWKVKLIALNNDWLIKNQSALKENLKVVTENASYQSEKVVSLNYANEKKGWYDQTSQTLIELKLPANNQKFSYLAVDCFSQKAYFLALNQPQLIQEGRDSNHPITSLQPTYFTDFKSFGETVGLKVISQPGINVSIPCFSDFSAILINSGSQPKTFLISEQNLNHYSAIIMDFLADNRVTNQINFNLPYRDFKLNWYGSDYILNYQGSQVLITGYQKEVELIFNDQIVTVAHNKLGSESPNLVINQTSQLSQRTEMTDEVDYLLQQEADVIF